MDGWEEDEEVNTVFISHKNLAIQHLVVAEDVVEHFLVEVFGRALKGDFHTTGFFLFEVDVAAADGLGVADGFEGRRKETYGGSRLSRIPTASSSRSRSALCSALLVASRIMRIRSLV